jgi:hypothetical protein
VLAGLAWVRALRPQWFRERKAWRAANDETSLQSHVRRVDLPCNSAGSRPRGPRSRALQARPRSEMIWTPISCKRTDRTDDSRDGPRFDPSVRVAIRLIIGKRASLMRPLRSRAMYPGLGQLTSVPRSVHGSVTRDGPAQCPESCLLSGLLGGAALQWATRYLARRNIEWQYPPRAHLPSVPVPPHIIRFIQQDIHSVLQLDVLLLLRERWGEWTPLAVAEELRITLQYAELRLQDLHLRHLLALGSSPKTYVYAPTSDERRRLVDELAAYYATSRYTVIETTNGKRGIRTLCTD